MLPFLLIQKECNNRIFHHASLACVYYHKILLISQDFENYIFLIVFKLKKLRTIYVTIKSIKKPGVRRGRTERGWYKYDL